MASIIPRVQGPSVEVQQGPIVRNTTRVDDSAAQDLARSIGSLAGPALEFAQREQRRNDTTAIMGARRQLSEWESSTFNPNNPEGIGKYRGKNALEADRNILPDLDNTVARISADLTPRQRQQFEAVALNFRDSTSTRLNGYMDREHSGYVQAEQKATLDNLGQDAVTAGATGDFARQDRVANELLAVSRAALEADGYGEEMIKAQERGIISSVRSQTIESMVTADPFGAQEYFSRYADQMNPQDRARVTRALYPVVEDAAAEQIALDIMGGGGYEADDPADIDSQIVGLESGGSNTATNSRSSAAGAGQFIDSTWLQVVKAHRPDVAQGKSDREILELKTDGDLAREMVTRYRQDNSNHLLSRGVPTTTANLYAAHHFGPAGAVRFANASPDTPMTQILSAREIAANPYLRGMSVSDVRGNWANRGLAESGSVRAGAAPESQAQALERARSIRNPQLRSAVTRHLRDNYALREMRQREISQAQDEQTFQAIYTADNPNVPLRQLIGGEAYARAEREGKVDALDNLRMRRVRGQLTQDDPVLVEALNRERVVSPNTFKDRNLYEPGVISRLSTDTLEGLLKAQTDANKPDKVADWGTTESRVDSAFIALGIDRGGDATGSNSTKKNEGRNRLRGEYRLAYQSAERTFIQQNGREPTPEQADQLTRAVTRRFSERMKDETTKVYGQEQRFQLEASEADRQAVVAAYRSKYGTNPTEAYVTEFLSRRAIGARNE